jgi:pimeloyl-ACP methyl ester carboxylesterase
MNLAGFAPEEDPMSWRVPVEARTDRVFPSPMQGRVERHTVRSHVLEGNPWNDPVERELPVYVPPSGTTEGRPLLLLLSGYTGSGWLHFQRPRYLQNSIVGRLDRLIRLGLAPEAVLASPDCLTTLGGSQFRNSSATGRYEDYVIEEVIPFLQERYRVGPIATLGTSSGGYGALCLALRHPELIRAAGSNAGDAYFEYSYTLDFPPAFREIRRAGGPDLLLRRLLSDPVSEFGPKNHQIQALETMAYASCYSPIDAEPGRFDLPFDLETGALRPEVWDRWLRCDPVRMVETEPGRSALRRLSYVYVDGGTRDEYALDIGARVFAATATRAGGKVDLEEFDGVHADAGPRYDVMIPRLLRALAPTAEADRSP